MPRTVATALLWIVTLMAPSLLNAEPPTALLPIAASAPGQALGTRECLGLDACRDRHSPTERFPRVGPLLSHPLDDGSRSESTSIEGWLLHVAVELARHSALARPLERVVDDIAVARWFDAATPRDHDIQFTKLSFDRISKGAPSPEEALRAARSPTGGPAIAGPAIWGVVLSGTW